ncbi:MAG: flavodoxin family protein [bacterium]|nr:flavodoxin family protein [bacterium]
MKIIAFNGSPHAEKGMTNVLVEEFLQGAQESGAEVETVFLARQKISYCQGCMNCWIKTPGECMFKDDMPELLSKFLAADAAVFASPLYIDNVSGMMKTFMDRLFMPIEDPRFEKDEEFGECRHIRLYDKLPKMVAMATCGSPEQSHFQALRVLYRRIARNFNLDLAAEIYRGGGSVLFREGTGLESYAEQYKELVREAGREFAVQSKFSNETIDKLEQPVLPGDDYVDRYVGITEGMFEALTALVNA